MRAAKETGALQGRPEEGTGGRTQREDGNIE